MKEILKVMGKDFKEGFIIFWKEMGKGSFFRMMGFIIAINLFWTLVGFVGIMFGLIK